MIAYYDPPPCDICDPRFSTAVVRQIGNTLQANLRPNEPGENLFKIGIAAGAAAGIVYVIGKLCERPIPSY